MLLMLLLFLLGVCAVCSLQESWTRSTKELLQWSAVKEYAVATSNASLALDACSRIGQFDVAR